MAPCTISASLTECSVHMCKHRVTLFFPDSFLRLYLLYASELVLKIQTEHTDLFMWVTAENIFAMSNSFVQV